MFKGNDLHSGFAPREDPDEHRAWVDTTLNSAWNIAGPQNRVGYVCYFGRLPCHRVGAMNLCPPTYFGNFGSAQVHKEKQKNFAQDGVVSLGGRFVQANRLGREIIYNFWNSLSLCNLELQIPLNDLIQQISYNDGQSNSNRLEPLPLHPEADSEYITKMMGLLAWFEMEQDRYTIVLPPKQKDSKKHTLCNVSSKIYLPPLTESQMDVSENTATPVEIVCANRFIGT